MGVLAATCLVLGLAAGPVASSLTTVARSALHLGAAAGGAAGGATSTVAAVTATPQTGTAATYAALVVGLVLALAIGAVAIAVAARSREATRRVDTWTCGIAPRPAFQYTATSYSKPIRLFFRRILVPEREVRVEYHPGTAFPSSIRYRSEITLLLEDRILRPAHRVGIRGADFARKLQGGAIQLYVAYIVIAVLALLVWAR
jgi:LPXTG-motif cell wall-anchored protein